MEKKELLNEERYQNNKKKLITVSLCVFIIGLLIGGGFIFTGTVKTNEVKKENKRIIEQIEQKYDSKTSTQVQKELTAKINSLQEEADKLEKEKDALEIEKSRIFMSKENGGFSDSYYAKDDEIKEKRKEISTVESNIREYKSELNNIKSGAYESKKNSEIYDKTKDEWQYRTLYAVGGMIIFASFSISGSMFMMSKRREIMAFQAQQVMPIAQEGMEKMAPSVAKVGKAMAEEMAPTYGKIAKEIAKGVKEGMKDEDNKS